MNETNITTVDLDVNLIIIWKLIETNSFSNKETYDEIHWLISHHLNILFGETIDPDLTEIAEGMKILKKYREETAELVCK